MRKYNKENFFIEELEKCNIAIIDDREKYYIKFYNSIDKKIGLFSFSAFLKAFSPQGYQSIGLKACCIK